MATEIVTQNTQVKTIRTLLEKSKSQIAMALPRHMNADRLLRIVMTSIQRNPELLECTQVSLLGSIITGAQLGVEPDGVRAHLVPRRNNKKGGIKEAQLIVDYKGMMDLAARSGRVRIAPPVAVYEKDKFSYGMGLKPFVTHERYEGEDRGKLTHVYAVARYNDGFDPDFVVLPKSEVDRHRAVSPAKDRGPWVDNYEEMAKKTGVRVLCKYVPSSPELARAVALDEKAEQGLPQDIDFDPALLVDDAVITGTDGNASKESGALDALAEKMKGANGSGEGQKESDQSEQRAETKKEESQPEQQQGESKQADAGGRARKRF